jgi:hypothetical protein
MQDFFFFFYIFFILLIILHLFGVYLLRINQIYNKNYFTFLTKQL